jgi:pSer/pThr/pTyr-binding forkhead associated (FHA) protein
MAEITLRVLDGAERGRVFDNLPTPVTIGREEGNTIQLNDERISRYHIKIQEDHEKVVLTDLESTNGTKVNGEDIQLRILRFGDMITVGRSVILYGTQEQIGERLSELKSDSEDDSLNAVPQASAEEGLDFELNFGLDSDAQATLHVLTPPELPDRLSPGQAAQLSEMLEYLHVRIRHLLSSIEMDARTERVTLDARQWQNLLDLQGQLAIYLRDIGEPSR